MDNKILSQFPKLPFDAHNFPFYTGEIYKKAFDEAIVRAKDLQASLSNNKDKPTFKNTIIALEKIDTTMKTVQETFALAVFDSRDDILECEEYIAEPLSRFYSGLYQDDNIWKRIKLIAEENNELLNKQEKWLVQQNLDRFIKSGANLNDEQKKEITDLRSELAQVEVKFTKNVLEATQVPFVVEDESLLSGITKEHKEKAAEFAIENNVTGWAFNVSMPNTYALLTESTSFKFREKLWNTFYNRGNSGQFDNHDIMKEILLKRVKIANIMGFDNWAAYTLDDTMAKTPEKALELMSLVWDKVKTKFEKQLTRLQKETSTPINQQDWFHYSEIVLKKDFGFNEKALNEYLPYNKVRQGCFDVVNKIFGLEFTKTNLPGFAENVDSYIVRRDNKDVAIFYTDDFQRKTKRGGAWMDLGRSQHALDGTSILPIAGNALNIDKNSNEETLLNMEEVITIFHEMGHGLHGMLSNVIYPSQGGLNVPTDFVELPSQLLENWCVEPSVLKTFAENMKGETIPDELIDSWKKVQNFGLVFDKAQYLISAFQDMKIHMLSEEQIKNLDWNTFKKDLDKELGCPKELKARYNLTHFTHVFGWDYSARYYAYLWSAVLDSDVYANIKEKGIFNPDTTKLLEKEIYGVGHSRPVQESFKGFMGRDPDVSALLKRDGLIDNTPEKKIKKKNSLGI